MGRSNIGKGPYKEDRSEIGFGRRRLMAKFKVLSRLHRPPMPLITPTMLPVTCLMVTAVCTLLATASISDCSLSSLCFLFSEILLAYILAMSGWFFCMAWWRHRQLQLESAPSLGRGMGEIQTQFKIAEELGIQAWTRTLMRAFKNEMYHRPIATEKPFLTPAHK